MKDERLQVKESEKQLPEILSRQGAETQSLQLCVMKFGIMLAS